MKQNRGELMNNPQNKQSTVPRYSEKYKDVLERAMKKVDPEPIKPQKQLFFYRIKSIGVGAFSFVYMVKQQGSETLFAQKSIAKKTVCEELFNEIKLHLYLEHPNIIRLYHVYHDPEYIHLIMEYAEDSLFSLRKNKKIPLKMHQPEAIQILREILKGVSFLHLKAIIHADLKLENILICQNVIKICDFGLSYRYGENQSSQIKGTLQYLPPQYVRGKNSDYGRDLWAIGIIAYQLVTGSNPLENYSENQKWSKILSVEYIDVNELEISEEMKVFLGETLCPAEKRKSCQELLSLDLFAKSLPQTYQIMEFNFK